MDRSTFLAHHARMMRHAFLSGVVAARSTPMYDDTDGLQLWTEYEPHAADHEKLEAFADTLGEGQ